MPSASAVSAPANSRGLVAEHELDVELAADAEHRVDAGRACMHTPTTRMRASFGAMRIAWSIIPGTPTASKITSGRMPSTRAPRLDRRCLDAGRPRRRRRAARPGPAASARSRRRRSGRCRGSFSSAMHASPTGPQPSTMALSPTAIRLLATACTPTASGSVSAAMLGGQAAGHLEREQLVEHHQLGVAAGVHVGEAERVEALRRRRRPACDTTMSPTFRLLAVRAEVDHLAAELVAHHRVVLGLEHASAPADPAERRRPARSISAVLSAPWLQQVQVAAADAAGQHLGQHLPGPGVGSGMSSTRSCQSRITAARMRRDRSVLSTRRSAAEVAIASMITANAASASTRGQHVAVRRRPLDAGCAGR